jgi:hypothetical protein
MGKLKMVIAQHSEAKNIKESCPQQRIIAS